MANVSVLVITGNGTNCERETAFACQLGAPSGSISSRFGMRPRVRSPWPTTSFCARPVDFWMVTIRRGQSLCQPLSSRQNRNQWTTPLGRTARVCASRQACDRHLQRFSAHGQTRFVAQSGQSPKRPTGHTYFQRLGSFRRSLGRLGCGSQKQLCLYPQHNPSATTGAPWRGKTAGKPGHAQQRSRDHLAPVCYADPNTGAATEIYPANPNGSPVGIARSAIRLAIFLV